MKKTGKFFLEITLFLQRQFLRLTPSDSFLNLFLKFMHKSAYLNAQRFNETYLNNQTPCIVEIGSQVVSGQDSLRSIFTNVSKYIGIDFVDAAGVDIVIDDPYSLPLENKIADVVVSSSCLEHSEFFWLSFLEMCRISTDNSLIYLNVPSNGTFHK